MAYRRAPESHRQYSLITLTGLLIKKSGPFGATAHETVRVGKPSPVPYAEQFTHSDTGNT